MLSEGLGGAVAERYRAFASCEAARRSALYHEWALRVAGDAFVLEFLSELPEPKQQPNLLFAAVRFVGGETPSSWAAFRNLLEGQAAAIQQTMLTRATQTNEPARCAVLLPLLARLPGPLVLLEIGASAGLCLLPDFYRYRYGDAVVIEPSQRAGDAQPVTIHCQVEGPEWVPTGNVHVVRRVGLDLQPINLHDSEAVRWLQCLVWPDEGERSERLRQALAIASRQPSFVQQGDVRFDVPAFIERERVQAPAGATVVVFHSAVLPYLALQDREQFVRNMTAQPIEWIANEAASVLPAWQSEGSCAPGEFTLRLNGTAVGYSDPHGRFVRFFSGGGSAFREVI